MRPILFRKENKMKFPFVSRKRYESVFEALKKVSADYVALQLEHERIIGRAAELADIERQDRKRERDHVAAIFANRGEL